MHLFSVGLADGIESFQSALEKAHRRLRDAVPRLEICAAQRGAYRFFFYRLLEEARGEREAVREAVGRQLTEVLLEFILTHHGRKILERLVRASQAHFAPEDQREICRYAVELAQEAHFRAMCEAQVRQQLEAYLRESSELCVDGFVRFRLPEYPLLLEGLAEEGAELYMNDVEYDEFIRVLQYFVEANPPQAEIVQVKFNSCGPHLLLDEAGVLLQYDFVDTVDRTTQDEYEELLICTLINLAPKKILLQETEENTSLAETLRNVFRERIEFCREVPRAPICSIDRDLR